MNLCRVTSELGNYYVCRRGGVFCVYYMYLGEGMTTSPGGRIWQLLQGGWPGRSQLVGSSNLFMWKEWSPWRCCQTFSLDKLSYPPPGEVVRHSPWISCHTLPLRSCHTLLLEKLSYPTPGEVVRHSPWISCHTFPLRSCHTLLLEKLSYPTLGEVVIPYPWRCCQTFPLDKLSYPPPEKRFTLIDDAIQAN